jgi:hypothetical protein
MAHTDPHGHGSAHGEFVGHETTDASLGGVERFLVVLTVFLAVCFVIVWLMYRHLQGRAAAGDVRPSPVVQREGDRLPPLPRLQRVPYDDLAAFHASEQTVLDGWAWVDRSNGIAQVPISRAIEILAERGLPTPPPQAPQPPPGGGTGTGPGPSPDGAAAPARPGGQH